MTDLPEGVDDAPLGTGEDGLGTDGLTTDAAEPDAFDDDGDDEDAADVSGMGGDGQTDSTMSSAGLTFTDPADEATEYQPGMS